MKKAIKIIFSILGIFLLGFLILLSYLWIREYRPEKIENVKVKGLGEKTPEIGKKYKIMTWNIGYAGLDKDTDFFYGWRKNGLSDKQKSRGKIPRSYNKIKQKN